MGLNMTKSQALNEFFNSFGITAFPNTSIPEESVFPWLTYENKIGNAGDSPISISVNLYYYTDSEAVPNKKVEEIADALGLGGKMLPYDGGAIWIQRGNPWCIAVPDESNSAIKKRQLDMTLTFL